MTEHVEIPLWQSRLIERQQSNEFLLADRRERHWRMIREWRSRYTPGSNAWQQYDCIIKRIQEEISGYIADMRFTKELFFVGPIKGDMMALPINYGGRTLIQIIDDESDKYDAEDDRSLGIQEGMGIALDILRNPQKYLNEQETAEWIKAESDSKKIIRPTGTTTHHVDQQGSRKHREPTREDVKRGSVTMVQRRGR